MAPIKTYYDNLLVSYSQIASCVRLHRQQYSIQGMFGVLSMNTSVVWERQYIL
jgi:hypothetical protein